MSIATIETTKAMISSNLIVVFSKTTCGFCSRAISFLQSLIKDASAMTVIQLNTRSDGNDTQKALAEITTQRTVPNIFIGRNHVGGYSDLSALHSQNKLIQMLEDAGVAVR